MSGNDALVAELLAREGRVQTVLGHFDDPRAVAERMARGATATQRQFLRVGEAAGLDGVDLKARLAEFLREFRELTGIQHGPGRVLGELHRMPEGFKNVRVWVQGEAELIERFERMGPEERAEVLRRGLDGSD